MLVGGWTNPFEKYARKNGFIFPQFFGVKITNIWVATTYCWWKKSQTTTWDGAKTPVNNGVNYQPQLVLAGFQPSTVVSNTWSCCSLEHSTTWHLLKINPHDSTNSNRSLQVRDYDSKSTSKDEPRKKTRGPGYFPWNTGCFIGVLIIVLL